ncbi:sugar ABC transporter substrate-binding protein [Nonomuraea sp. NPDC050404]|uniref:sugar ABC transporter substrate-binding protein n=1 Tax=Nonomuraea sp. NPDC050404 TaxID=3155783 RepID=UPI0033E8678A
MTSRSRRMAAAALALLTLATACSTGENAPAAGPAPSGRAAKDIHVAFVGAAANLNFSQEMMAGAKYAGQELGADVQVIAPPGPDGQAEVGLFQQVIATAKDGVGVMTLNPELFTRPAADAIAKGVPVVAADVPLAAESGVTTLVSNDNPATGAMLADAVLAKLPSGEKGTVVLGVPTPGLPVLEARAKGMKERLLAQNPGLEVLGPFDSKQSPDDNYKAWSGLVRAHSGALAFLDTGDPAAFNLPKIKQETGAGWLCAAFDLNDAGLAAIQGGQSVGVADPQHWLKGYVTTRLLIERALGKREIPKGFWDSGAAMVTKDNVAEIIARQKSPEAKAAWYRKLIDEQFADVAGRMKPLS